MEIVQETLPGFPAHILLPAAEVLSLSVPILHEIHPHGKRASVEL